ncbi:YggT family protein [Melaminivora alkalimesophila]|uniref:YggT family protein n=1 Tax=Melaminivora alkalimesophila TaxID=1165852 RepID=A0A317RBD3_9BURK|nr:YggT family protein [Melaminivora alkalimesophila]PWW45962.1 YggT family protein [Melaminivora alkalimesophila]
MLLQILTYLLDVATGLLAGACLLRLFMQLQRVPFGNPVGRLVFALTDWLVLPLRKVVPPAGRWDVASLLGAFLLKLVQYLLLVLLLGGVVSLAWAPVMALFGTARVALMGLMVLVIAHALLSWVQVRSPIVDVVGRLCEPLLAPVRRVVPLLGGVDLSPLVLLVLLQVLMIVLTNLQAGALSF